ncbi:MAG: tetratricopeptide repeat protein [Acidobacteria bacterium]|nr:tetratricopeptide repeat protein [Acidobacteriota bacterium]
MKLKFLQPLVDAINFNQQNSVSSKKNNQNILIILVIVLTGLVCFSNSLLGEFISDDHSLIVEKYNIKSLSFIPDLFFEPYFNKNDKAGGYRPITNVSYALNYAVNGLDPYGYHLVNIILHIINCLLIYWLCNFYCKNIFISLFTSLLFAIHPVHSEAVAAIYGRPELLCTFFILIAWMFYTKSIENKYFYILSLITYFLSLFSKENGIIFIGILFLVQFCTESTWIKRLKPNSKLIGYILITIPFLILRSYVVKAIGVPTSEQAQFFAGDSIFTRIYTMSLGYLMYFKILIWPKDLLTIYTYTTIPKQTSLSLSVILALLIIFTIILIGIWQVNKRPLLAFSLLFFFIVTSVISNIVFPIGILIAERVIYLASLSICLLFAITLYWFYQLGWKKLSIILSIFILLLSSVRTYFRNQDFLTDISVLNSAAKYDNKLVFHRFFLGLAYQRKGDLAKAEECFKAVIASDPSYLSVCGILATIFIDQGRIEEALPLINQELSLVPDSVIGHVTMGRVYNLKQDYKKASEFFLLAIKYSAPDPGLEYETALMLEKAEDFEQAAIRMKKAIELNPTFIDALIGLANILHKQNRYDEAISVLDKALSLDSKNAEIYSLYGANLLFQNKLCEAKDFLIKSISLNNNLAQTHYNLGLVYIEMNLFSQARYELLLALQLNPLQKNLKEEIASLNKKIPAKAVECPK